MSRYELTEQSRQELAGEYIPAAPRQPIINVHVHNHTVQAEESGGFFGMIGGAVKWSAIGAVAFVGVMYLQGHEPIDSVNIAKERATEMAPEQVGVVEAWYYKAKYFVLGGGDTIAIASRFIGMTEDADKAELSAYIKTGGLSVNPDNTAWCAAFVGAVLAEAGMKGTGQLNAKSYLQWGVKTETPKIGDVVVLWRGSREDWRGHVGFFNGFDPDGNILILGGNQDDKVSVESFHPSRILAYRTAR